MRRMETKVKRMIKGATEFDHLFPAPSLQDKSVKGRASVEDTLKLIRTTVPQTLWHTEKIARVLKGRTLNETCRNIWHFVYEHIQYKRDKDGVEQVRSPRRTWWERKSGVDCDCYTEFISSILFNLKLPHKVRITKYPKKPPQIPQWQHIYPVVPKDGSLDRNLANRDDYFVIDCVKDEYDSEQHFLEAKDYDMKLEFLDGLDEAEVVQEEVEYADPDTVDLADLASVYDDEQLGNIFKKIGSAVKKVTNKVGGAVKTVAQDIKKTAPVLVKKIGDAAGDVIRTVNRFANPATILLRNGFLLAMKINLMNTGGRLRYAYLTDAQAQKLGIDLNQLQKLRTIKDRAETVYWQAGGKKENLKKAILNGKGNKDKKVPLSGLFGLDDIYQDMDEYNIIHSDPDNLEGLGEIASGTAIAAATSAVAAIAGLLSQVKGLFSKGGSEEAAFQSETDNAGSAATAPANISEDEDLLLDQTSQEPPPSYYQPPVSYETQKPVTSPAPPAQPTLPVATADAADRRMPVPTDQAPKEASVVVQKGQTQSEKNFLQRSTTWVKENPGKTLLIAGAVAGGSYLLVNALKPKRTGNAMNGLPKKKKKGKSKKAKASKQNKIKSIKL
jgi:hypothetical protein